MRFNPKSAGQLALITLAAASITACASKKPVEVATAAPMPAPTPAPSSTASTAVTATPTPRAPAPVSTAPLPGSAQDFVVNVGDRVFFDYDQHEIRADARPVLDAQAQWLQRYPSVSVRIEGNADERGTREYNFALGARRASSVRDYLVARGVPASRIETVSYGKERPIDSGQDETAWAKNRNGHTAIVGGARGS
jgi:peptidoglycan-associated lipoprotein